MYSRKLVTKGNSITLLKNSSREPLSFISMPFLKNALNDITFMDIKTTLFTIAAILSCTFTSTVYSAVAVVVNLENPNQLDERDIRRIFLGKTKTYPNGVAVKTFDLPSGNTSRDAFRAEILRKSESRLNAYWARMLFSSKAKPPEVLQSSAEVKAIITANPQAIAYIDKQFVDASIKVVFNIE